MLSEVGVVGHIGIAHKAKTLRYWARDGQKEQCKGKSVNKPTLTRNKGGMWLTGERRAQDNWLSKCANTELDTSLTPLIEGTSK